MNLTFHHVALTVKNLSESIEWYESKLGFTLIKRYKKQTAEIAHLTLNNIRIELFHYDDRTEALPKYREQLDNDLHVIGTKHICIETDNLDQTIAALREKEVEIVGEAKIAGFGGKYIFIKDCNSIFIELFQA